MTASEHDAGRHELILCGVELERRKADRGEHPLRVLTGSRNIVSSAQFLYRLHHSM